MQLLQTAITKRTEYIIIIIENMQRDDYGNENNSFVISHLFLHHVFHDIRQIEMMKNRPVIKYYVSSETGEQDNGERCKNKVKMQTSYAYTRTANVCVESFF